MTDTPKSKRPRQRRAKDGDLLLVGTGDGRFIQAVAVEDCAIAFFAPAFAPDEPVPKLDPAKRLFTVVVSRHAVTSGLWRKIGKCHPSVRRTIPFPEFFIHSELEPNQWSVYAAGEVRRAKREQCVGLERCCCWEPHHIEDRIRANLVGEESKWECDTPLKP
jgi:hypothetical protein